VVDIESPMIDTVGAGSFALGAKLALPSAGGTNPGVDAASRLVPSGEAGIICGCNTL
jgi:hypothetical protein